MHALKPQYCIPHTHTHTHRGKVQASECGAWPELQAFNECKFGNSYTFCVTVVMGLAPLNWKYQLFPLAFQLVYNGTRSDWDSAPQTPNTGLQQPSFNHYCNTNFLLFSRPISVSCWKYRFVVSLNELWLNPFQLSSVRYHVIVSFEK